MVFPGRWVYLDIPPGEGGGLTGPTGVARSGLIERMGIGRNGCAVVRSPVLFPVEGGGVGKKCIYAGVRRKVT
jgi:hypothetical protein